MRLQTSRVTHPTSRSGPESSITFKSPRDSDSRAPITAVGSIGHPSSQNECRPVLESRSVYRTWRCAFVARLSHPGLTACSSMAGALAIICWSSLLIARPTHAAEQPANQAAPVTYEDDVRPILRTHCFACHNRDQARSGLALDSYARLIEGGSGGEVVYEDDLDSSRLWALVSHQEEPTMPPGQDKLADAKLSLIRRWIEGGLLENSGSTRKKKKQTLDLGTTPSVGKPSGPAAMPEGLSLLPVVETQRAAAVSALATSPWAPLVAVAGQQQIILYHADDARLLGILPFPEGNAYSLRFSRDGAMLLAGGGHHSLAGWTALYDVQSGDRLLKVGDELDSILASDLNVDLTRIAFGGPKRVVRIFSTETGEMVREIRKHNDWIFAVRYSPDGVLLATGDRSNGLFVWEAETAREYLNLRGHTAAITDVAWSPDSNVLASVSLDGSLCLWEMHQGKRIKRWNAHAGGVHSVAFAHDGRIATAGHDHQVKIWQASGKQIKAFSDFKEPALKVAFSHDGKRLVAGDWSGTVCLWNIDDGQRIAQLPPNPSTPSANAP